MPSVVVESDRPHYLTAAEKMIASSDHASLEEELFLIVAAVRATEGDTPSLIMETMMGLQGRLTEMWLHAVIDEPIDKDARRKKSMVQKVMDLVDFQYKGASRLLEAMRMEAELSK